MARSVAVRSFGVPLKNREVRVSALNHKPMNRMAGLCPTDLTSEFLQRCHKFLIAEITCSLSLAEKKLHCNAPHVRFDLVKGHSLIVRAFSSEQEPSFKGRAFSAGARGGLGARAWAGRVCTDLHHTYTIPSNNSGGSTFREKLSTPPPPARSRL